jgi:type I restriction enzyme M protein
LLDVSTLGDDYDLSVKNPNKVEEVDERTPQEIANSIVELNEMNQNLLNEILALL